MAEVISLWVVGLSAAIVFLSLVFAMARRLGRYDLIDTAWGMTFIVTSWTWAFLVPPVSGYSLLVYALLLGAVTLWGMRLSAHIGSRFAASKAEDLRYVELRKKWRSKHWSQMYMRIYMVQALLATIVVSPLLVGFWHVQQTDSLHIGVLAWLAIAVWVKGFVWESIGDWQLRRFIAQAKHKGTVMQTGLWRYSRHPNYFGELTQWWGIGLFVYAVTCSMWAFIGPAVLSYLIIWVSGIPPAERQAARRTGWAEYKRCTSILVPFPPRR